MADVGVYQCVAMNPVTMEKRYSKEAHFNVTGVCVCVCVWCVYVCVCVCVWCVVCVCVYVCVCVLGLCVVGINSDGVVGTVSYVLSLLPSGTC